MGRGGHLWGLRSDGTQFPVEIGLNPMSSAEGDLVLASVVDISVRVAANAEREELVRELRAANSEIEEFTSMAAHDLRELIRNVLA